MTNPLHAAYYADHAQQRDVVIAENIRLARDTYRLRFGCAEIARRALPGQFFMLRLAGVNDPLLGRAFALYDTVPDDAGAPWGIDVVYLAKGKFTRRLAATPPGATLTVWGPLGNGFAIAATRHLIMVAGGIGQTPFLALAAETCGARRYGVPPRTAAADTHADRPRVTLCYGARSAEYLAGIADFERVGVEVRISTEDGSRGQQGLVTALLEPLVAADENCQIVTCGPQPMLEAVARLAARVRVACHVSLETPMACGIGICFACVAKIKDADGQWDYKRTCVEGPVFDAAQIEW